jgi:hypothetical protein
VEVVPPPREPDAIGLAASTYAFARALGARVLALRLPTSLAVVLSIGALGVGALTHELSRSLAREPSPPISVPATAPATPHASELVPSMRFELDSAAAAPTAATPLLAPEPARQLVYKWRRMRREIFVPLAGDVRSHEHFRVGEPLGITIDLPNVPPPEKLERHAVRKPGVQRVDVGAGPARGTRIRVWATRPFDHYTVEATRDGIRITIPGPFRPQ